MKISTNSIGNYRPLITSKQNNIQQSIETDKINKELKVTNEEKKFFSNLYPEEKDKISNYHYYSKDGGMKGVSIGSIFDKRG